MNSLHKFVAVVTFIFSLAFQARVEAQNDSQKGKDGTIQLPQPAALKDVVAFALRKSPALKSARWGISAAERGTGAAKNQRIPKLAFIGMYDRESDDWPRPLIMGTKPGTFQDTRLSDSFFQYGARATWPLFTGGRIRSEIKMNEAATEMAEAGAEQTQGDLIFNLSRTYYSILMYQKFVDANQKAVESLAESKRIVEQALTVGKAAPLDGFRISTRLANVQQNLIKVQNALDDSYSALNVLMGIENPLVQIKLADSLRFRPRQFDLETSIATALQKRPGYRMSQAKLEMQKRGVGVARSMLFPNLSVSAQYLGITGFNTVGPSGPRDDEFLKNWNAVVTLSFPIIDNSTWSKIGQESAKAEQAREELEQTRLQIIFEVRSAYLDIQEAAERVKATQAALEQARESLRIEQLKLETGKGIVNDVLDAQAELLQAETNYYGALADYNVAIVALQRAMGSVEIPQ